LGDSARKTFAAWTNRDSLQRFPDLQQGLKGETVEWRVGQGGKHRQKKAGASRNGRCSL